METKNAIISSNEPDFNGEYDDLDPFDLQLASNQGLQQPSMDKVCLQKNVNQLQTLPHESIQIQAGFNQTMGSEIISHQLGQPVEKVTSDNSKSSHLNFDDKASTEQQTELHTTVKSKQPLLMKGMDKKLRISDFSNSRQKYQTFQGLKTSFQFTLNKDKKPKHGIYKVSKNIWLFIAQYVSVQDLFAVLQCSQYLTYKIFSEAMDDQIKFKILEKFHQQFLMSPVIYDYKKNQEKLGIADSNANSNSNTDTKQGTSPSNSQYRHSMSLTYNTKTKNQLNCMLIDNNDHDLPTDNLFNDLNPEKTTKQMRLSQFTRDSQNQLNSDKKGLFSDQRSNISSQQPFEIREEDEKEGQDDDYFECDERDSDSFISDEEEVKNETLTLSKSHGNQYSQHNFLDEMIEKKEEKLNLSSNFRFSYFDQILKKSKDIFQTYAKINIEQQAFIDLYKNQASKTENTQGYSNKHDNAWVGVDKNFITQFTKEMFVHEEFSIYPQFMQVKMIRDHIVDSNEFYMIERILINKYNRELDDSKVKNVVRKIRRCEDKLLELSSDLKKQEYLQSLALETSTVKGDSIEEDAIIMYLNQYRALVKSIKTELLCKQSSDLGAQREPFILIQGFLHHYENLKTIMKKIINNEKIVVSFKNLLLKNKVLDEETDSLYVGCQFLSDLLLLNILDQIWFQEVYINIIEELIFSTKFTIRWCTDIERAQEHKFKSKSLNEIYQIIEKTEYSQNSKGPYVNLINKPDEAKIVLEKIQKMQEHSELDEVDKECDQAIHHIMDQVYQTSSTLQDFIIQLSTFDNPTFVLFEEIFKGFYYNLKMNYMQRFFAKTLVQKIQANSLDGKTTITKHNELMLHQLVPTSLQNTLTYTILKQIMVAIQDKGNEHHFELCSIADFKQVLFTLFHIENGDSWFQKFNSTMQETFEIIYSQQCSRTDARIPPNITFIDHSTPQDLINSTAEVCLFRIIQVSEKIFDLEGELNKKREAERKRISEQLQQNMLANRNRQVGFNPNLNLHPLNLQQPNNDANNNQQEQVANQQQQQQQ